MCLKILLGVMARPRPGGVAAAAPGQGHVVHLQHGVRSQSWRGKLVAVDSVDLGRSPSSTGSPPAHPWKRIHWAGDQPAALRVAGCQSTDHVSAGSTCCCSRSPCTGQHSIVAREPGERHRRANAGSGGRLLATCPRCRVHMHAGIVIWHSEVSSLPPNKTTLMHEKMSTIAGRWLQRTQRRMRPVVHSPQLARRRVRSSPMEWSVESFPPSEHHRPFVQVCVAAN